MTTTVTLQSYVEDLLTISAAPAVQDHPVPAAEAAHAALPAPIVAQGVPAASVGVSVAPPVAAASVASPSAPIPRPLPQAPAPEVPPTSAGPQPATAPAIPRAASVLAPAEPSEAPRALASVSRWLRFLLVDQYFAVELLKVQEVLRVPDIVPVRGAAQDILGVINLRGQIVPVRDAGHGLGLPREPITPESRLVVLESHGESVALLVTSVANVIALSEAAIERPAEVVSAMPRDVLAGVARQESTLTLLLDAERFLV